LLLTTTPINFKTYLSRCRIMTNRNKEITRKSFLETSIAVGTGLLLTGDIGCKSFNYKNFFTGGNKIKNFVESFPDEKILPMTRSVRKFYIPDSKHCLVHIRQSHYEKGMEKRKWEMDEINCIQEEIYGILEYLIEEKGLTYIYPEGLLTGKRAESIVERAKIYYEKIKKRTGKKYVAGADKKLIMEGRLNAKPSELPEIRQRLRDIEGDGLISLDEGPERKRLYEQKEYNLLQLIVDNKDEIGYTIFGAEHAWGGEKSCGKGYNKRVIKYLEDNLENWNKEHRDEKFSLIEVTPHHYYYDKKLGDDYF
jgi:hypothetical protein